MLTQLEIYIIAYLIVGIASALGGLVILWAEDMIKPTILEFICLILAWPLFFVCQIIITLTTEKPRRRK
jgi:hypothetical protein